MSPAPRKTAAPATPPRRRAATPVPTTPPDFPADDSVVRVLRRFRLVFNTVKGHFREVEKAAGLAGAQVWALSVIRDRPGVGVTALARAMDVHQSTASNLVRSLVEQNLVAVDKRGDDRRTVQLRLRPAGARALARAPGPFIGVLPAALASLDAQTLARLDKDLAKLTAAIAGDRRDARIPLGQP